MNNQLHTHIKNFEPEMIQSKPLSEKEKQKLSQIIKEAKSKTQKGVLI